jgi:hypothetical protein
MFEVFGEYIWTLGGAQWIVQQVINVSFLLLFVLLHVINCKIEKRLDDLFRVFRKLRYYVLYKDSPHFKLGGEE